MAINVVQVESDYRWKRRLEKSLALLVDSLWSDTARRYIAEIRNRGWYSDPNEVWGERLQGILVRHYEQTASPFSQRLGAALSSGVKPTDLERMRIDESLARALSDRAISQRRLICSTTYRDMGTAAAAARRETQRVAAAGAARSAEEEAVEAGQMLARRLRGRTSGIASLETQAPAELAKIVEAEVLLGHTPAVDGGTYAETEVIKRWWSQGDDIVRPDHLMADQQEQLLQSPFEVGADLLAYPGDTSLGAPLAQVVNCRCSSVIDEDAVASARAVRGLGI